MVVVISKNDQLTQLAREIEAKNVCVDLAVGAKQLVIGDGDAGADIVFVGEAPGAKEDEQGIPFVGAAGKFLNEMLASANMKREDVYITNIVKYRPPNNRDPTPEEKREFWPYLMRQLEIIEPRVVITLGRHSGAAFVSDLVISRDHGRARRVKYHDHEFLVIPLYHPAAALYNGSLRQTLIDDFLSAAKLSSLQK